MKDSAKIQAHVSIRDGQVFSDGKPLFAEQKPESPSGFFKKIYTELDLSYPKFHKMDNLSKLAFLSTEILLGAAALSSEEKKATAIVLSNRSASLDIDRKHQESITGADGFYPSPGVFVYTLPNIGIGEISIRHKMHGESAFFVFEAFNIPFMHGYVESLWQSRKARNIICGWVDVDGAGYRSFLYLVSGHGRLLHTTEEIAELNRARI